MFASVLKALPLSENMKIFLGVAFICGLGYLPIATKGQDAVQFDTMYEKQEALQARQKAAATPESG